MKQKICDLLGISLKSYYNWKDSRKIITFLEKYFNEHEIQEYLLTNKISKLELIKNYSIEELKIKLNNEHLDPIKDMEEYLIVNVKYKIDTHVKSEIYKKILKSVLSENDLIDTANDVNAKKQLLQAIKKYNTSFFKKLQREQWIPDTIDFVSNYLISDEVFLIIKYPDKFLEDK